MDLSPTTTATIDLGLMIFKNVLAMLVTALLVAHFTRLTMRLFIMVGNSIHNSPWTTHDTAACSDVSAVAFFTQLAGPLLLMWPGQWWLGVSFELNLMECMVATMVVLTAVEAAIAVALVIAGLTLSRR